MNYRWHIYIYIYADDDDDDDDDDADPVDFGVTCFFTKPQDSFLVSSDSWNSAANRLAYQAISDRYGHG